MYIENIVIGQPIVDPSSIFASDIDNWNKIEKEKTYFTTERYLPRILVELGIYPSISEIRRNKPQLMTTLDELDYIHNMKVSKKRRLYILVGEKKNTLLNEQLKSVLCTLTAHEQKVLQFRFGLDDGLPHTLEDVGKEFNMENELVRQVEAKALRKINHKGE